MLLLLNGSFLTVRSSILVYKKRRMFLWYSHNSPLLRAPFLWIFESSHNSVWCSLSLPTSRWLNLALERIIFLVSHQCRLLDRRDFFIVCVVTREEQFLVFGNLTRLLLSEIHYHMLQHLSFRPRTNNDINTFRTVRFPFDWTATSTRTRFSVYFP